MALAIQLAKKGGFTTSPNPRVGCVIVRENQIVGQGFHVKAGLGHAEVNAIKQAGIKANGATAYVTLEPCSHFGRTPPCAKGLVEAGVKKVICAMVDPNPQVSGNGIKILEDAGIEVHSGLLEEEARALNKGFVSLMTCQMPYVRCKLAASLDGKTAMANGESQWITSTAARKDVQRLRAKSCAIITGADSVIMDKARMNVRLNELNIDYPIEEVRQPVRVIIDSQSRLTPDLAIFNIESEVLIVGTGLENKHQWPHFVEHIVVKEDPISKKVQLKALLSLLAERGLNDVLIESGQQLAGAFIEQDLVNELVLYQAPKIMGSEARSLALMPNIKALADSKKLAIKSVSMVGEDIKITALFREN